jgi:hypothetical protein
MRRNTFSVENLPTRRRKINPLSFLPGEVGQLEILIRSVDLDDAVDA